MFSQRKGLKPAQKVLQVESIDDELRNSIWSCIYDETFNKFVGPENYPFGRTLDVVGSNLEALCRHYWFAFFKAPTDTMPNNINEVLNHLRKYFFSCPWNEVYDFVEFTLLYCPGQLEGPLLVRCNEVLERENAGYRIVARTIVEITNKQELADVEAALESPIKSVQQHIQTAAQLLSDRKNPDYRNSIKESISAIEAICRRITGDEKATLGAALSLLQPKVGMHAALKAAFSSLYGYTSDEQGIRHAMLDEPNLTFSDAKFMLVACSSFVNYVVGKAAETGLKFR